MPIPAPCADNDGLDDINAATVQVVNLVVNNRSKIKLDEGQVG
jgi:hypothetical protein